jgi:coproporphyrinogen III oxidase
MQRNEAVSYLKSLRETIIAEFESIEQPGHKFQRTTWPYSKGEGGGEISLLRGAVFEKAAVNWSGVAGDQFPGNGDKSPFFATGVSLITHPSNPKMPTVHFNIRYIEVSPNNEPKKWWLGGGFDLTPMGFAYAEDTAHFHKTARETLAPFGADLYEKMSAAAKDYFTIRHYQRERGVGGIFFDHYRSGDDAKDWQMWKAVGDNFLKAIMPIYLRRRNEPFTAEERATQLKARAHYVEFNLLYDRGTKFGFESGGNPAAILCSMPPLAAW